MEAVGFAAGCTATLAVGWGQQRARQRAHAAQFQQQQAQLAQQQAQVQAHQAAAQAQCAAAAAELQRVAHLSPAAARAEVRAEVESEARESSAAAARQIVESAQAEAAQRAQRAVLAAMQRMAGEWVTERTVRVLKLPSDEVKGRIIGREGRNIRAFEAATGVDLIVDDTPEVVVLSSFHPLRREIAAQAMARLVLDGRIHPARIEAAVEKASSEVRARLLAEAETAVAALGADLATLPVALLQLLGELTLHAHNGQNELHHALETATLAGLLAAELGLPEAQVHAARRAGLLHDVGKSPEAGPEGDHASQGAALLRRLGENPAVVQAVAEHHAAAPNTVLGVLVQAANRLSSTRPGTRRPGFGTGIARQTRLESLALEFAGVKKAHAIQAGREVRIMVDSAQVSDDEAWVLCHDIARRVQDELSNPGEVRVTVIREARAIEIAR